MHPGDFALWCVGRDEGSLHDCAARFSWAGKLERSFHQPEVQAARYGAGRIKGSDPGEVESTCELNSRAAARSTLQAPSSHEYGLDSHLRGHTNSFSLSLFPRGQRMVPDLQKIPKSKQNKVNQLEDGVTSFHPDLTPAAHAEDN